jgi:CheY-like chemotaxis protein
MAALSDSLGGASVRFDARVLVVEDNPVNQKVAAMMLAKLGIRADMAADGREGVEMARILPYDIVLMDCQMPEMNGYEAAAQIRLLEGPNQRIPIVAMTAEAIAGCRERCLEAGMSDMLTKPVKLEELSRALKAWLQSGAAGSVGSPAPAPSDR